MPTVFDGLTGDLKHGFRALARDQGFAAVALVTLALGIGANTAIFSVINGVLLKALPYPEPDRLVVVDEYRREHGSRTVSWMDFQDWRQQNRVFDDLAAYRLVDATSSHEEASLLRIADVSAPFFRMLGAQPLSGRLFDDHDDSPHAPPTIVISHTLWMTRFSGRPDVLGQLLSLNDVSYSVIGVLPPTFDFFGRRVDAYVPVGLHGAEAECLRRGNHPDLLVLARLRAGITLTSARTALDVIMRRLELDYPQSNTELTATLTGLYEFRYGNTQRVLVLLFAAVGCVLLIACANVANLLLARACSRTKEMAIRAAIGAGRWRLVRQVVAESMILALGGGALGIVVATLAERAVTATAPRILHVATGGIDGTVLAFAALVSIASGLLFGGAPAVQIRWRSLRAALIESGLNDGGGRRGHGLRSVLLVAEIATALVLLTAAGLVLRSLSNAMTADPGFEPEHLLSLELTIPPTRYTDPDRRIGLLTQAVDRLNTVPGIRAAGAAQCPPLSGVCIDTAFMLEDHPVASVVDIPTAASNVIAPGYFETLRVPLLSGRLFSEADNRHGRLVAIVNRTFEARYWPHDSALGKRIREGGPQGRQPYREVVGVVADVKQSGMDADPRGEVFLPVTQFPFAPWTEVRAMTFVVRTDGDPASVAASAKSALVELDKDLPVTAVRPMLEYVFESLERRRCVTQLLTAFAVLALLLAAVGTYGVMTYDVSQSTNELALRIALGASPRAIRALVMGRALALAASGIALGSAGALLLTRWLNGLLFGVRPSDPVSLGMAAGVLLIVAMLATTIPVQRAIAVDPASVMRGI